jgi:hypothetical protein
VNGLMYGTFKDECNAMDLLQDDGEWIQCLEKEYAIRSSATLCNLFVLLFSKCHPIHPELLWQHFCSHLCGDLQHRLR